MLHTRTTRRYAKVLFNMARETGQVENVRKDLTGLRNCLAHSRPILGWTMGILADLVARTERFIKAAEGV